MIPGTPDADLQCITPLAVEAVCGRAGPRFGQIPSVAELISDWATQIHADTARRKVSSVGQCPDSLQEFPWFEECAGGRDLLLTVMVPILTD